MRVLFNRRRRRRIDLLFERNRREFPEFVDEDLVNLNENVEFRRSGSICRVLETSEFYKEEEGRSVTYEAEKQSQGRLTFADGISQIFNRFPRISFLMFPPWQPFLRVSQVDSQVFQTQLQDVQRRDPRSQILIVLSISRERRRETMRVQSGREYDVLDLCQCRIDPLLEYSEIF